MNRTYIGLIGAAVLGALTGCSGDGEFYSEEMELGSTAQALSWTGLTPAGFSSGTTPKAVKEVASCKISDTKMLVAGGDDSTTTARSAIADAFIYDASNGASGTWSVAEKIMSDTSGGAGLPRAGARMVKVPGDDKCVLIGGYNAAGTPVADILVYDLSADDWDDTGVDLATPRYAFDVAFHSNSEVLVFGGTTLGAPEVFPTSIEEVTISGGFAVNNLVDAFGTPQGLSTGRKFLRVVALDKGRTENSEAVTDYYVVGGETGASAALTASERISVSEVDDQFEARLTLDNLNTAKSKLVMFPISQYVPLAGGAAQSADILAVAGNDAASAATATAFAFVLPSVGDPDGEWAQAKSMTTSRIRPQSLALTSGDFLVTGGASHLPTVNGEQSRASEQVWDDSAGDWTAQSNTVDGRTDGFALEFLQASAGPPAVVNAFSALGLEADGASPPARVLLDSIEEGQ